MSGCIRLLEAQSSMNPMKHEAALVGPWSRLVRPTVPRGGVFAPGVLVNSHCSSVGSVDPWSGLVSGCLLSVDFRWAILRSIPARWQKGGGRVFGTCQALLPLGLRLSFCGSSCLRAGAQLSRLGDRPPVQLRWHPGCTKA